MRSVAEIDPDVGTERFELLRRIGEGGMGVVYHAVDRTTGAAVALKTLRHVDGQGIYRLKQEFRTLSDVEHPNLVRLGELRCEEGRWFFTMELVEGPTLLDHVASDERLPFDEARLRVCLAQLVQGLAALHDAGLVHRDVKPSNVRVTPAGRVVLLDFGLATAVGGVGAGSSDGFDTEDAVGTVAYMAPEQAAGLSPSPAADWYSVGVVLFEALTGRRPFVGSAEEIMMDKQRLDPPAPRALCPLVPADLDALVCDLLRFDPLARPTGAQLLGRLGLVEPTSDASTSSTSLQRRPFVGRTREIAALHESFARSRQGRIVQHYVVGESGIGKSALVRRFFEEVMDRALVLSGRCYQRESVPFKAFDGIVDGLSRYLNRLDQVDVALLLPKEMVSLARIFPVLKRVPAIARARPPREPAGGVAPAELRARAFAVLRALLASLCEREPVVLFIDDLQWADADSLALFAEVVEGEDAPPVLLVAAVRSEALGPDGALPFDLGRTQAECRVLRLERLEPRYAEELATRLAAGSGVPLDEAGAVALAAEAGCHPLFIHELVRHRGATGARPTAAAQRLDDAIWWRVERLDRPARRLLCVVAVADAPIARAAAAEAAELDADERDRSVGMLRVAHLLRVTGALSDLLEPYHDRVREAVQARLGDDERRLWHARLADALERHGAAEREPRLLVRHLLAAGLTERAAARAERAAELAREALAFEQAAEFYEVAVGVGGLEPAEERALRLRMAEALQGAGRGAQSARAFLEAARGAEPAVAAECRRAAAMLLLNSGHVEEGLEVLRFVLAEAGESLPRTRWRAVLSLLWLRALLAVRGLRCRLRPASEAPPELLARFDLYSSVTLGLAFVDGLLGALYQSRCLLIALRAGEPSRLGRALFYETIYASARGRRGLRHALRALEHGERARAQVDDPYLQVMLGGVRGMVHFFSCEHRLAAELLARAERNYSEIPFSGERFEVTNARLYRILAQRHLGGFRELKRLFDDALRDALRRGDRYTETVLVSILGMRWLLSDEPARLRRELARPLWSPPVGRFHVQHWHELVGRVELDLYEGLGDGTAQRLAPLFTALERSLLLRVLTVRSVYWWLRGRLALCEASRGLRPARAVACAARYAARLERTDVPANIVWAKLLSAAVAAHRGETKDAIAMLTRARDIAFEQGLLLYSAVARYRLGELVGGEAGVQACKHALAWMASEEIVRPERVLALYAPGFPERG